jgi:signal transduction histidine kinase/DNA-binding response OmpR family regulator
VAGVKCLASVHLVTATRLVAWLLVLGAVAFPAGAGTVGPVVSTYVGNSSAGYGADGGDRRESSLVMPGALAWGSVNRLFYSDSGRDFGSRIRRIDDSTGIVETVAGGGSRVADGVAAREAELPPTPTGLAIDSHGNIFVGSDIGGLVHRIDARTGLIAPFAGGGDSLADAIPAREAALVNPWSVRIDAEDNVYICDIGLHAIFRVDADTGLMHRVAGTAGKAGHAGDGGPATAALLNWPTDVVLDRQGNLYVADRDNHVVRLVDGATGIISTFAGTVGSPGFAGDGGDKLSARFSYPQNLLLDGGWLYVADRMNHRVRRIELATGIIATFAGSGSPAHAGENVPALEAGLFEPVFLVKHPSGGLLVAAARARRIYLIGEPVDLLVPWWRSGWAIAAYVAALLMLVFGFVQLRTRALRTRTAALEASVALRARQLAQQKALAERQTVQLGELIETKDRLLARISHEFRTPLTVILGPIDRLLERESGGLIRSYLETTRRNASRLLRLVEQLLGLARLTAGHAEATGPVAAAVILSRVVASFDSLAVDRGVALTLGPVADLTLQSTAVAIETIAVNLVSNAVRFTQAGGGVRVSLDAMEGMGRLIVADSGCGIAAARMTRIFQPFAADADAAGGVAGSGLGLALVKQLVTAHGGSVEVESVPGRGSVFRVRLPVALTRADEMTPALDPARSSEGRLAVAALRQPQHVGAMVGEPAAAAATVLVIEDNADMRSYLGQVLGTQYRCVFAEDGQEGVERAAVELPDLVVSDVMLPGRNGYAVCHALKSNDRTSHIPVILLTALEGSEHKLRGLEERADDFLTKPFNEAELLQRIVNLLEIRSLLQRRYARDLRFDATLPTELGQRDQAFLGKLARVTEARYTDPELSVDCLASALAVSERHLQRKVKALVGLAPAEYLRGYRLQRAHERLRAGERPSDVTHAVGFGSHAYFTACFKAQFGYTPGEAADPEIVHASEPSGCGPRLH